MKKLFYLLLVLPVLLLGCKKGTDEPEAVKLTVTPNSIISPSMGADYSLTLIAPEAWTASCADSWVKVNPTSGNAGTVEISVKIAADKTSTEASSKIIFKSGDQTVEVPVKRLAKDPARLMVVSETEIQTPKEGGVYSITIESNIKWQISSDASWAKIEGQATKRDNATITVNVDEATKPEETVATITVTPLEVTGVEKQTVIITRGASDATSMTIDKIKVEAPSDGGTFTIQVNTTAKWRATKSWEADWITLSDNEQTGSGSFTIKVDPATSSNTHSTVVTVEEVRSDDYKPVQLNVLVTRNGKPNAELSVEPTTITSPAEGGTYTVSIQCNYAWSAAVSSTQILTISPNKGDGDGAIVVSVKPTTEKNDATAKITIKSSYGNAQQVISVRRLGVPVAGKDTYFSVSDTKKVFFSKGNLQYYLGTAYDWRFAPEQYMVCGEDNKNRETDDNWIDLFGYGTSGVSYSSGDLYPSNLSLNAGDYYPFAIEGTDYDWGVYITKRNKLSLDATTSGVQGTGQWRTLTTDEWRYLIYNRSLNSAAFATIEGQQGLLILPDGFQPTKVTLQYLKTDEGYRIGPFNNLSLDQWRYLEKAGTVFLPVTGCRQGKAILLPTEGYYWTSTAKDDYLSNDKAEVFQFIQDSKNADHYIIVSGASMARTMGCAVRLVQDAN